MSKRRGLLGDAILLVVIIAIVGHVRAWWRGGSAQPAPSPFSRQFWSGMTWRRAIAVGTLPLWGPLAAVAWVLGAAVHYLLEFILAGVSKFLEGINVVGAVPEATASQPDDSVTILPPGARDDAGNDAFNDVFAQGFTNPRIAEMLDRVGYDWRSTNVLRAATRRERRRAEELTTVLDALRQQGLDDPRNAARYAELHSEAVAGFERERAAAERDVSVALRAQFQDGTLSAPDYAAKKGFALELFGMVVTDIWT